MALVGHAYRGLLPQAAHIRRIFVLGSVTCNLGPNNPMSDWFDLLLSPLGKAAFLERQMGKSHLVLEGDQERFLELMSWHVLTQKLLEHRLDFPRLRLVRQGKTLPHAAYIRTDVARRSETYRRPDAPQVERLMREGAMLHLAGVDELHSSLGQLAESVENSVGSTCFVNLHAGLHSSRGFDVHWDGHEVCVLQIEGRKFWRVYGITDPAPLPVAPDQKGTPPKNIIWEGMLEAGSVLYLPRGCWHAAEAVDGPSLHLSVGWENPTGNDFIRWLSQRMRSDLTLRHDGPRSAAAYEDYVDRLSAHLQKAATSEAYAAFLSDRRVSAKAKRQTMRLP